MNYLPIRIVPGKTVHKATSIAITTILVTAMFVGLIPMVPAVAAANMSVSQTRLGTNNVIKITVSDTALTNHPTVVATVGTNQTALTGNMFRTPLGEWILFIARVNTNVTALGSAPTVTNGTAPNSVTAIKDGTKSLIETIDIPSGTTSITLTYSERSEVITITSTESSASSLTADRTTVPPNAKVYLTLSDTTKNRDPTVKNWVFYGTTVQVNGVTQAAVPSINFTETDVNSGSFTATLDLATLNNVPTNGDLVSVIIGSVRVDLSVASNNGVLSAPSTITYSEPINVTLTDADRNLDSNTAETLTTNVVRVVGTVGTAKINATVNLKETGKNTGVFYGTIAVNVGTAGLSGNISTSVTYAIPAGTTSSFVATYTDPASVTANWASQATFTLSVTAPTVALDKTAYLPASSVPAVITLTNPNANDDKAAVERLTITNNSKSWLNVNSTNTGVPVVGKLNITETKSGVTRTLDFDVVPSQFVEDGVNTGVFKVTLDLETALNGTRTAGTTLTVKYYDAFTKTTVTTSVTIGGAIGAIALDRTALPLPLGKSPSVTVTINDSKANVNPSAIDTVSVNLLAYNATNQRLNLNTTNQVALTLTETGINTGVFSATVKYTIISSSGKVWVSTSSASNYTLRNPDSGKNITGSQIINGKLVFGYTDPLATGGNITATGMITPSTATLSVSPSSVGLNQSLTATLTEADENLNPLAKDSIYVNGLEGTTALTFTLTETGNNTGIFTSSKRVGSGGQAPFTILAAGETVTLKYIDNATATSYYGTGLTTTTLTGSASVPTSTATMRISATNFGPFSTVVINVTDADLVFNSTTPSSVTLARIQTSKLVYQNIPANKSLGNGAFQWTLTLYVNGTTVKNIMTAPVDTMTVYFVDKIDASGNTGAISSLTATITSMTGQVALTPSTVLVGQFFTVSVTDSDQNKNPNVIEAVTVSVTSTSWPIGQTITLPETAPNTGVFSAQVQVSSGLPTGNQIRGATGDTVSAKYTDRWNSSGLQSTITASITVGTSQVATERVPASTPSLRDTSGNVVAAPTAGSLVVVQAAVRNNATTSQTFTYIVQIKNANGQVVFLNWIQNMTLAAGQTSTPGISWTPSAGGTYTIQVFVWDSLTGAQARSPVFTQTVTVS